MNMHKNNIPQSTNKSNKSYQHARLFDFDLLQFNRMKRQISIKIYCWMVFHARITYQDQKVLIRKTGMEKNNISQKTFETILGKSRSVIQSGIKELKDLGLLTVKQRLGNPAIYELTTPKALKSSALQSSTPKALQSSTPRALESKTLSDRKSKAQTIYNNNNTINNNTYDNSEWDFLND
jgi:DNA-binding transcriptional ArsR family regulator